MPVDWELRESGPADAERTVLLLPGGMCSAGSFAEVMEQPALSGMRLGGLPVTVMIKGVTSMVKRIPVSPERQAELRDDFRRNVPAHAMGGLREYLRWLKRGDGRAARLCEAGVPAWVVHAEKGDGGLTDEERRTLEACPHVHVVTIPGHVFFLPNEVPERIAEVVVEAAGRD